MQSGGLHSLNAQQSLDVFGHSSSVKDSAAEEIGEEFFYLTDR